MQAPSVRQFYFYWLPPLLATMAILVFSGDLGSSMHTRKIVEWLLSLLSFEWQGKTEDAHGYFRKAGHVIAYGGLYWLWFRAFLGRSSFRLRTAIFWSLGFCLLTAMMDEGHQALASSRQGRVLDVALDFGAAAVAALALSFKRI